MNLGHLDHVFIIQIESSGVLMNTNRIPAERFRWLVAKQRTGAVIAGGSWDGIGRVQHRVHPTKEAGTEAGEGGAAAASTGMEGDEEWVQQASWGGARVRQPGGGAKCWWMGRRRCQLWLQAGLAPARAARKVQTLGEKAAADESYEERQMLWKGMTGRSWSKLVQQW